MRLRLHFYEKAWIATRALPARNDTGVGSCHCEEREARRGNLSSLFSLIPVDIITEQGQTLAQAIWLSGVPPPPLCAGLGACGHCRVRYISPPPEALPVELARFTSQEIMAGWRLACRHTVDTDTEIFVPSPSPIAHLPPKKTLLSLKEPLKPLVLAIDIGTTSVQWRVLTQQGERIAQGQEINPQMAAGAEVMSRLAFAQHPKGRARLAHIIQELLRRIVQSVPAPVSEICLAANTAMTAIALGYDTTSLATAPYHIPFAGNTHIALDNLPPIYIPPQPAPFVGGDVSAGMAFVQRTYAPQYPFLFVDMGTNGECVLALTPHESLLASVPLGPALEGVGLACGGMASADTPGAVIAFTLTPQGLAPITLGHTTPTHICAVGYFSLLHTLRRVGILDTNGVWQCNPPTPLGKHIAACIHEYADGVRLDMPGNLYCTARDIEEFLKVKAAFSWALATLLGHARLAPRDIHTCYLAGALGMHINIEDMRALGFIPEGLNVRAVGNTALDGAELLLLHPEERASLAQWSAMTHVVDLTLREDYMHEYLHYMRFA